MVNTKFNCEIGPNTAMGADKDLAKLKQDLLLQEQELLCHAYEVSQ